MICKVPSNPYRSVKRGCSYNCFMPSLNCLEHVGGRRPKEMGLCGDGLVPLLPVQLGGR